MGLQREVWRNPQPLQAPISKGRSMLMKCKRRWSELWAETWKSNTSSVTFLSPSLTLGKEQSPVCSSYLWAWICLPLCFLHRCVYVSVGSESPRGRAPVTSAEMCSNGETGSLVVRLLHAPGLGQPPASPPGAGVPTPCFLGKLSK